MNRKDRALRLIERADERVDLLQVLSEFFDTDVPSGFPRSWKTWCPFGGEHPDGGEEKALRVYPSNSAYCFAGHGVLGPVRLIQLGKGMRAVQAAEFLLRHYHIPGSRPWRERFSEMLIDQATQTEPVGSSALLASALQEALQHHPGYARIQYAHPFITRMEFRLDQLDRIMAGHPTEEQVRRWFQMAKADLLGEIDRLAS